MIVYVLFVHKKSASKIKVCINKKKIKNKKKTFLVGFFRWVFWGFLGGFFWGFLGGFFLVGFLLPTLGHGALLRRCELPPINESAELTRGAL